MKYDVVVETAGSFKRKKNLHENNRIRATSVRLKKASVMDLIGSPKV